MTTARRSVLSARALALTSAALIGVGLLAGCGDDSDTASTSPAAPTTTAAASSAAAALTLVDPYVKASTDTMTGVFGVLTNSTGSDITVVSGSSPVAGKVEMHEVAMVDGAMKMRPKAGGFVVPANGTHVLKPGSDHVMLLELTGPITAGQSVAITLTTQDGTSFTTTAIAKVIAGGAESYLPSGGATMSPGTSVSGSGMPSASASS